MTPPPVSLAQLAKTEITDRVAEVTREYARAVGDVVKDINDGVKEEGRDDERVALVDVWTALWGAAGKAEKGLEPFLSDGLHLTSKGYGVSALRRWSSDSVHC